MTQPPLHFLIVALPILLAGPRSPAGAVAAGRFSTASGLLSAAAAAGRLSAVVFCLSTAAAAVFKHPIDHRVDAFVVVADIPDIRILAFLNLYIIDIRSIAYLLPSFDIRIQMQDSILNRQKFTRLSGRASVREHAVAARGEV